MVSTMIPSADRPTVKSNSEVTPVVGDEIVNDPSMFAVTVAVVASSTAAFTSVFSTEVMSATLPVPAVVPTVCPISVARSTVPATIWTDDPVPNWSEMMSTPVPPPVSTALPPVMAALMRLAISSAVVRPADAVTRCETPLMMAVNCSPPAVAVIGNTAPPARVALVAVKATATTPAPSTFTEKVSPGVRL